MDAIFILFYLFIHMFSNIFCETLIRVFEIQLLIHLFISQ